MIINDNINLTINYNDMIKENHRYHLLSIIHTYSHSVFPGQ